MKKYHFIPGFEYTKQPYDEYIQDTIDLVGLDGYSVEDLGVCSDGINRIYGLSLGNPSKPTIFIQQTHGLQEWRTCYWIRGFAKELVNPTDPRHRRNMLELRKNFHFYFIPCLNVYGYINNTRWNANQVDLNRNYDYEWEDYEVEDDPNVWGTKGTAPFSEVESQISRDKVLEYRPVMFLDFHTWGARDGATNRLVAPNQYHFYWLGRDVQRSLRISYPDKSIHWAPPYEGRPTAANWAANQKSAQGFYPFVSIPESGGGMPEWQQSEVGMTMAYVYCMHMLDYMQNKNLIVN